MFDGPHCWNGAAQATYDLVDFIHDGLQELFGHEVKSGGCVIGAVGLSPMDDVTLTCRFGFDKAAVERIAKCARTLRKDFLSSAEHMDAISDACRPHMASIEVEVKGAGCSFRIDQ